jgi:hypothetical protein
VPGAIPCTARGSSVIRMRQGTVPRGASPRGTGLALAFRTLLSFQGTSPGCSSATRSRFPRHVPSPERRGRYHGPLERGKDFPPVRSVLLAECCPPHRHVTQKRRPAPPPAGRRDGHRSRRTNPVGVRRPPVFRCRRRWRRPGEVLGPEELPCLQLREGSTGRDVVSTAGRRSDTMKHNGSSLGIIPGRAGRDRVGRRMLTAELRRVVLRHLLWQAHPVQVRPPPADPARSGAQAGRDPARLRPPLGARRSRPSHRDGRFRPLPLVGVVAGGKTCRHEREVRPVLELS